MVRSLQSCSCTEASVTVTETCEAAESLSGTDQTHTATRQERVTGSIRKAGVGEVICGGGG